MENRPSELAIPQSLQLSIGAGSEVPAEQQPEMITVPQNLQEKICELDQRLTEIQTAHSGSDPELPSVAQLSVQTNRISEEKAHNTISRNGNDN